MARSDSRDSHGGDTACAHCGLAVPPGLIDDGAELQFCCGGCRAVYRVLHQEGLEGFYRLAAAEQRQPARTTPLSYAALDDPTFSERHCQRLLDGLRRTELYLEGVHCTACVWLVERLPRLVEGVVETRLDLGQGRATLTWDPEQVALSRLARSLDSYGYPSHPFRGLDRRRVARAEDRRLLIRIAVAGAAAANVMLIAFALYAGMFSGIQARYEQLFRWASLLLATPAVLYSGSLFFRGAIGGLRAGSLHIDLPISIGILAGYAWGGVNTVRGAGEIYFDSVTTLIFLLLVGRWLQRRQQRRASDATELLFSLTPTAARVVVRAPGSRDERLHEVPAEALTRGTMIEVRTGESIPVDGVVLEGRSAVDASLLSGESRPLAVGVGDSVRAGTVNVSGRLRIEATAVGEQTRLGQLMRRIEEHAQRRAPIVLLAEQIAGRFVAATLSLAALTAVVWLLRDPSAAVDHAIALLIVTCPCALGLATPLAVSVAIGNAARQRILIQGGDALERLARPGRMILDKTGTLTEGRLSLVEWRGDEALRPLVAALEAGSAHPVARAACEALASEGNEPPAVTDAVETLGGGIVGTVAGVELVVGSPTFVAQRSGASPADWVAGQLAVWTRQMLTPVLVARQGEVVAAVAFGDRLRSDAKPTLRRLERAGWRIEVLSGDDPDVVAAVGRELGLEPAQLTGGASPEQKLARVQRAAAEGPVVMVGDGVNDAAALAAATAGVAVHGGAEASLAVADVAIGRPGLAPLVDLLDGARITLRTIKRNFVFSLAYNLVGASLAGAGLINPLVAALLMPASSLTVLASSLRTAAFRRRR